MKHIVRCLISFVLMAGLAFGLQVSATAEEANYSDEQSNAIAMLNYITVLTQDINESKNSRIYMEEAYSALINNTYPNAVDSLTLGQLNGLLDTMERYRMIDVKRERIQYLYEQNQAQAIRAAIPNPLGLLSAVKSGNLGQIAASIVYMAVDSVTSYTSYKRNTDLQFIQDGWALDDDGANALHESRKNAFSYMIEMVQDYNIPGDITLTEQAVEEFVKWKNNSNVTSRIQFLESNKQTYQGYGGYWILLAESYYSNSEYQKCLDALDSYNSSKSRIFRKDYDYARILPLAIDAASQVYDDKEYESAAAEFAKEILSNTDHDDWALRYFVGQTYIDLFGKTNEAEYLDAAYSVVLDNVNYLVDEQHKLNDTFLAPVKEIDVPKDATKAAKEEIKNYNKMLKQNRKTELPPVYEPLRLNCDLLFALASERDISEAEQKKINDILHANEEPLFLTEPLDAIYWAGKDNTNEFSTDEIDYAGTAIKIPAMYVTNEASITVTISNNGNVEEYTGWTVDKVSRAKNSDMAGWIAIFTCDDIKQHDWIPGEEITVTILPEESANTEDIVLTFKTVGTKDKWYDYMKVWEGQNNDWYDYLKVWDNKVVFEREN